MQYYRRKICRFSKERLTKGIFIMFTKKLLIILSLTSVIFLSACNQTAPVSGSQTAPPAKETASETMPAQTPDSSGITTPPEKTDTSAEIIKSGEPSDTSDMTKTYSCAYDINSDGITDNISLYINAQKDKNGILMLEDSNRWILEINDGISAYTLFDENISNGSLYAEISEYYIGDNAIPTLSLIKSSGTGLIITNYTYNKEAEGFAKTEVFSTDSLASGGINKISSSIPEPGAID